MICAVNGAVCYSVADICLEQMDSYHTFIFKEDRWTGQTALSNQKQRVRISLPRNHLPFLSEYMYIYASPSTLC